MNQNVASSAVSAQYDWAHRMHYESNNLEGALPLYRNIMKEFPHSKEAAYSCTQIRHIVKAIVEKDKLLDAQIRLAQEAFKERQ